MLVVSVFDAAATGIAYAATGVPHPLVWAAITGLLALVPFVANGAVAALSLQLALAPGPTSPLLVLGLACLVLLCGDKIVRPMLARHGIHLRFVWVLMGCLGGFEVLGLVGLVIGPVVLTILRELWEQHVADASHATTECPRNPDVSPTSSHPSAANLSLTTSTSERRTP